MEHVTNWLKLLSKKKTTLLSRAVRNPCNFKRDCRNVFYGYWTWEFKIVFYKSKKNKKKTVQLHICTYISNQLIVYDVVNPKSGYAHTMIRIRKEQKKNTVDL